MFIQWQNFKKKKKPDPDHLVVDLKIGEKITDPDHHWSRPFIHRKQNGKKPPSPHTKQSLWFSAKNTASLQKLVLNIYLHFLFNINVVFLYDIFPAKKIKTIIYLAHTEMEHLKIHVYLGRKKKILRISTEERKSIHNTVYLIVLNLSKINTAILYCTTCFYCIKT